MFRFCRNVWEIIKTTIFRKNISTAMAIYTWSCYKAERFLLVFHIFEKNLRGDYNRGLVGAAKLTKIKGIK